MAEILIKAVDAMHADPDKDRRGCYKRGMMVVVKPDGHEWGSRETLPKFVVLKVPGITVDKVQKYIAEQIDGDAIYRRRLWRVRWEDLPLAARNKLASSGGLTIKATANYTGDYDYTWTQIKTFIRNQLTNQDETEDL